MSEIVFLNDSLVPRYQAMISALDYGFLYGYGLFETMRAYGGQVFRLDRHLDRLERSARILGMSTETLDLKSAVEDVVQANQLSEARVRITISIGEGEMIFVPNICKKPTVLILAVPYQPYPEQVYQKGFRAIISSILRNSQSPISRLKSVNYLENILTKEGANTAGADEALCLNEKGFLAEGSMSNLFVVTDGVLRTPGEASGILPGITRGAIIELAEELGIKAVEDDITLKELIDSEEAFLTNSLIEVMPLTEVDGKTIAAGRPGSVTRKIMNSYKQMIRRTA